MVPTPLRPPALQAIEPPRTRAIEAIVIGGSAGCLGVLATILPGLPEDFLPVVVVVHVLPSSPSRLAEIFAPRCAMRVTEAEPATPIERGNIYFAPSDYHLLVEPDRRCALSIEPPVLFSRPAIDVLFESAASVYGAGLVGVVLTGASRDGAQGLRAIHEAGGLCLIQDPATAEATTMPLAALAAVPAARVVTPAALLAALGSFQLTRPVQIKEGRPALAVAAWRCLALCGVREARGGGSRWFRGLSATQQSPQAGR